MRISRDGLLKMPEPGAEIPRVELRVRAVFKRIDERVQVFRIESGRFSGKRFSKVVEAPVVPPFFVGQEKLKLFFSSRLELVETRKVDVSPADELADESHGGLFGHGHLHFLHGVVGERGFRFRIPNHPTGGAIHKPGATA